MIKSRNRVGTIIICIAFVLVCCVEICYPLFGLLFDNTDDNISLADGFTIQNYKVVLDVREDNKVDVTEYITVDWYSYYHHGIYKFTPEWLEYTPRDGKTIKRKSKVYNLRAL